MVEPYCSEITREDLRFLEEQIKFCEDIGDVVKIPPLGRYYGEEWDEENLGTEQAEGENLLSLMKALIKQFSPVTFIQPAC